MYLNNSVHIRDVQREYYDRIAAVLFERVAVGAGFRQDTCAEDITVAVTYRAGDMGLRNSVYIQVKDIGDTVGAILGFDGLRIGLGFLQMAITPYIFFALTDSSRFLVDNSLTVHNHIDHAVAARRRSVGNRVGARLGNRLPSVELRERTERDGLRGLIGGVDCQIEYEDGVNLRSYKSGVVVDAAQCAILLAPRENIAFAYRLTRGVYLRLRLGCLENDA